MSSSARLFETDHLKRDLGSRSARGGAVTVAAQGSKLVLHLVATAVLARLLAPDDFGLLGMVLAVSSFLQIFQTFGLTTAMVQRADVTHAQVSALFWLNAMGGALLSIALFVAAPLVASFYGRPELVPIARWCSLGFVASSLGAQHQALLMRQMRFGMLAAQQVGSFLLGVVLAIAAAWMGWGYFALVVLQLAPLIFTTIGCWLATGWIPGFHLRGTGIRPMLALGGHLTGFTVLNYAIRNADNALIGWRWGATELGLYSRAYGLLLLPLSQINAPIAQVVVPAISRLQHDREAVSAFYCRALRVVSYLTAPLTAMLIVLADDIVLLVLGPQWEKAGLLFRILAIAAIGQPILNSTGWLYIGLGLGRPMLRWAAIATPFFLAAFALGLPYGSVGVAIGYAVVDLALRVPGVWYACRASSIRMRDVLHATGSAHLLSAGMLVAMYAAAWAIPAWPPLARVAIVVMVGLVAFAVEVVAYRPAREELDALRRQLPSLLPWR